MAAGNRPLSGCAHGPDHFDEPIAKSYEAKWPELFEPAMVDPVVAFLTDLAGTGAALELG